MTRKQRLQAQKIAAQMKSKGFSLTQISDHLYELGYRGRDGEGHVSKGAISNWTTSVEVERVKVRPKPFVDDQPTAALPKTPAHPSIVAIKAILATDAIPPKQKLSIIETIVGGL